MSIYYSKFALDTYAGTLYFQAHIPAEYPIYLVLQKSRAFRRLPKNVKTLAEKARRWAVLHFLDDHEIDRWYDANGNELDPDTGRKLSDREIDAQWTPNPDVDSLVVTDIPIPDGGFPDPDEWELDEEEPEIPETSTLQFLKDVASRGIKIAERVHGVNLGYVQPKSLVGMDHDKAKKLFFERATKVVGSQYFNGMSEELGLLTHALQGASIYEDLEPMAQDVFDRAEEYNFAADKL